MHEQSAWARNVGTVYDHAVQVTPEATAIILPDADTTVSYSEFATEVAQAGNALLDLGLDRGDRVALCFTNGLPILATFFGAMRAGLVPVPVNVEAGRETIRHVVADSAARLVVSGSSQELRLAAADAVTESPTDCRLAAYGGGATVDGVDQIDFEAAIESATQRLEPVTVDFDDPALQPYSSGSTGVPKGIVLSHGGAYWNAKRFQQVNLMDAHDVTLVAAPLYHKNAMLNTKTTLLGGGTVVVMDGFDSSAVIRAVDTYDVTYLTGVPVMYEYLVDDDAALATHDVSSVEVGSTGSDTVHDPLYDAFETKFGAPLTEGYGLTEGGPMVTMTPRWGVKKRGSAGIPLPEVDTRIVDPETGEELPPGEPGELLVASPGVAEYHNLPAVSADRFEERNGTRFLSTGDLVYRDTDGYHYVLGRLDDMMIVGGENVYPASIENRLERHDAVAEAVVVPVPHEVKNEVPVAFVVASDSVTAADLKEYALEQGPAYAHPRRVFLVDDLPLTGTGKVDRDALEERARAAIDGGDTGDDDD